MTTSEASASSDQPSTLSMKSIAAMLFLATVWGLSIPATKLGLETMPPLMMTALRFFVAVPVLMAIAWRNLRLPWRAVPSVFALGVMGITLGNVAQSFGIQGTSASVATIISATIPIFIVVFAALRLKQHVFARQWLGLLAAFAGIALVALGNETTGTSSASTTLVGVGWMLLSAVAIGFYYVWSAELSEKHGTLPVTAWNAFAGLLAIIPMAGWEMAHSTYQFTPLVIGIAAYLGVMVTGMGILLWLYLLRTVPARVAASVQFVQPVFGIGASALLFGDQLGGLFFAGVALILVGLGLAIANRRNSRG